MDYIGVTCTVTMQRTLYVPKGATDEETLDTAKREIVLPGNVLAQISQVLHNTGIRISGLDLKDWETTAVDYKML